MSWPLIQNSLLVSGCATLGAVILGLLAALWLLGLEAAWRRAWLLMSGLVLVLPPFLVTGCWLRLLGYTGVWHGWLPFNIYSLPGTVWVLMLMHWPITLWLVWSALQRLEPAWLESDPALRGWALARWLLWPLARASLVQSMVLTFVLCLNNFAVPAILQVKVFPAELWVNFNTTFDYRAALLVCWPLVLAPLLLILFLRSREFPWPRLEGSFPARLFRRQLGPAGFWLSGGIALGALFFSLFLPAFDLASQPATWRQLPAGLSAGLRAFGNSFSYAAATATICVALGIAGRRWPLGVVWWLMFLMPGVLLGIALIFLLNRPPFLAFYRSFGIVVLAWVLRYLALGWIGAAHARRTVDPDLTGAAQLDGASGWMLFRHAHLPQMAPVLAAVWYLTFLFCLWDVETLILIVPPGGETVALRVFNLLHYGHNPQVNALCLLLMGLAALPALLWFSGRWAFSRLPHSRQSFMGLALLPTALVLGGCGSESSRDATPISSGLFSRAEVIGSRGTGSGQFNKPRSVAVDRQDNLYVVDMTARVQKFDSNGVFLLTWQMEPAEKGKPKGMDFDRAGNVIVVEPHYSRVNHFSTEGKLMSQWGQSGTNAGQLAFPRAVAVNSRGELLISEYGVVERVHRFSALGKHWLNSFGRGGNGPGELNRAEGLGTDREDRVYVADSCNHRIQVFTSDGRFLRAYGTPGEKLGEMSYPYDVRVDRAGLQFVCEFGNSRIQVFDDHDRPVETIGGSGFLPGQFNNPWSIAMDSAGNLYVADSANHRVQKLIRKNAQRPTSNVQRPTSNAQRSTLNSGRDAQTPGQRSTCPSPLAPRPSPST